MDIVLHIGLAKCASSTLQNRVFRRVPGYIGTQPELPLPLNFGKQFQHLCPVGGRRTFDLSASFAWRDKVMESLADTQGITTCILSSENLSSPSRHHPMPIIAALDVFKRKVWTHGKVKVVLVVRNQIDRLASTYAQFSHARPGAGQSDFRRFVTDCVNGKRAVALGYTEWTLELRRVLGQENVRVLLLEDMSSIDFWSELKAFCDIKNMSAKELMSVGAERKNARGSRQREWSLRPLDSSRTARAMVNVILNKAHLKKGNPIRRYLLHPPLYSLLRVGYFMQGLMNSRRRDSVIMIDDYVETTVSEHCAQNNRKLASILNRDLAAVGYPV